MPLVSSNTFSVMMKDIVTEATVAPDVKYECKSVNPEAPMAIQLIIDSMIMRSGLKPVTDPISFQSGDIPTDGGLFSPKIFGTTPDEKEKQFAYIDLAGKFFHPYIYEIFKTLMPRKFERCAAGSGRWKIEGGELVEIDKDSPDYNTGESGIKFLVENYRKFNLEKGDSLIRGDRVRLLKDLTDDEIIISKFLVVPILYRDIDKNSSTHKLPELNNSYNHIIRYANSLRDSTFDFFDNQTRFNLQMELVNIRKYGQTLIEGKKGFLHRSVLGKSVDRGSRDVISVPTMVGYQKPEDKPVDIFHSGIPIAKCLILGYDFILRWILQFFADNFRNMEDYPVYKLVSGEYKIVGSVKIKDPIERFSAKYIEKKVNRFKNSHATRFELVTLEAEDGTEIPLHLNGAFSPTNPNHPNATSIVNRPMTWTDLLYLACEETLSDKYIYITRYPITSHNSIFASQCRVLSTIKTISAIINGKEYPYYPYIDLSTPTNKISNLFVDTVTMSNMHLDIIGGDFDGDTTIQRLVFSLEANEEAKQVSESVQNFVAPDGTMIRKLGKEAYLTFYNMTRRDPPGKILSEAEKKELLALKKEDLTIKEISRLFGYTSDGSSKDKKAAFKVTPPKFDPRARLVLQPGEYINKTLVNTTAGCFLFNKLMVEGSVEAAIPDGYYNEEVNKKKFDKLGSYVAQGIMNGILPIRPNIEDFLNAEDFWGLGLVTVFSPSYSLDMILPNPQIEKKKEELRKTLKDTSLSSLVDMEDKIVKEADNVTKGSDGKYMFDSGARGSFDNDYKNMMVSIGPVQNPITGQYDFMQSSYIQGISKDDLPAAANIVINAEYPKAIGTADGGYKTKQFYAVFQSMQIDEHGTDCGTHMGLTVTLTKDNLSGYVDQYLIDGNSLVLITPDLPSKYMNRPVKIRSPLYCTSKKLCNKCVGERFYKVGINNIGLTSTALTGSLQNASLKLRHNMKIRMDKIDETKLLI